MLRKMTAALALAAITVSASAADIPAYPFIHVDGSAEIRVTPNVGEFDVEISSMDTDPELAWKTIEARLAEIRTVLAGHGIAAEDYLVQDIARRTRKGDTPVAGMPPAIETTAAVHVTVRDLSKWAAIVDPLAKMQNVAAFGVAFSHTDRDKIEAGLMTDALADARRKAALIARGVGRRLGQANGVATSPLKNMSNSFGLATDYPFNRGARATPDPVDYTLVASIRLAQNVDVIFRLQ
jgi:uncharacterized protein